MKAYAAISFLALLVTHANESVLAQSRLNSNARQIDYEVKATGLTPEFPSGSNCPSIASGWGSQERFDNSTRLQNRNAGLHGGLDISLKEGTPLIAMASGNIIAKGEGGMLEGIYLWLQHAQIDTGLPYRAVVKYQHLSTMPLLNVGESVKLGQVIANSGKTGTVGRAFGPNGYPHLHVNLFIAPIVQPQNQTTPPADGKLSDPLLLFLSPSADYANAAELPNKRISVAIVDSAGKTEPAESKVVWPVRCSSL